MTAAFSNPPQASLRPLPEMPGAEGLLGHLPPFRRNMAQWLLDTAGTGIEIGRTPLGIARRVVTVTSPELANEILVTKASAFFKSLGISLFMRPVLGDGLLTSEQGDHARARRLLAPAFSPKRMPGYAKTMAERAQRFASSLEDGARLDLAEWMMSLTLSVVGKALFDADVDGDAGAVGAALTTTMEVAMGQLRSTVPLPPMIPSPANLRYRRAAKNLDDVVYRIIRERRASPEDRGDVLSILLSARDEDGSALDDRQVRDEAMTLFLAGHETTANALAWTFYLLARNPHVRETLEEELAALGRDPTYEDLKQLPYTLAVFKEAMRLYPPAYLLGRRAIQDVAIGDHLIKKNSVVFINVIGLHHRPDYWPDPERFDPGRFVREDDKRLHRLAYMPFGAGPRVCIGNHFALVEGQLLLATVARRARFELTSDRAAELEPLVTLRPKGGVGVRVTLRH